MRWRRRIDRRKNSILLQKLMRGLGSGNVDHRLRQSDFSLDDKVRGGFWLGMPVAYMSRLDRMLVVGRTCARITR